jgi:hypothetical protein
VSTRPVGRSTHDAEWSRLLIPAWPASGLPCRPAPTRNHAIVRSVAWFARWHGRSEVTASGEIPLTRARGFSVDRTALSHAISSVECLAECARADRMTAVEQENVETRLQALEAEFVELRALLTRCAQAVLERQPEGPPSPPQES